MSALIERVERLRKYLDRRGWEVFSTNGPIEVWKRDGKYVNVLTNDGPYTERIFDEALNQLSKVERRPQEAVWDDIVETHLGRMDIFFDGQPVTKGGIELQFATSGLDVLRKLVEVIITARRRGNMAMQGRIAQTPDMKIADIRRGSFGFSLVEEGRVVPLFEERSVLSDAMDETARLLAAAAEPETLEDVVSELEPRVFVSLKAFVERMRIGKATVRVVSPTVSADLQRYDVDRAARLLSQMKRTASVADYQGFLEGMLSRGRKFEFRVLGQIQNGHYSPIDERFLDGRLHPSVTTEEAAQWFAERNGQIQRIRVVHIKTTMASGSQRLANLLYDLWSPDEDAPEGQPELEDGSVEPPF